MDRCFVIHPDIERACGCNRRTGKETCQDSGDRSRKAQYGETNSNLVCFLCMTLGTDGALRHAVVFHLMAGPEPVVDVLVKRRKGNV